MRMVKLSEMIRSRRSRIELPLAVVPPNPSWVPTASPFASSPVAVDFECGRVGVVVRDGSVLTSRLDYADFQK